MDTIHPVILSGGSGSRLWPLSRASYPKQLLALAGSRTMLQVTVERAMALPRASFTIEAPILVCNQEHRFLIREQCIAVNYVPSSIYLEPAGRNTAPAIALAALHLAMGDIGNPDALMLVLPADHVIRNESKFAAAVEIAAKAARHGYLVTFGIAPTGPETGYGYIQPGRNLPEVPGAHAVGRFVEKPDHAAATGYLAEGGYTWNSGMFMFTAGRYLEELAAHAPEMFAAVKRAWERRSVDLDFHRPDSAEFLSCPSSSIDYSVMQATSRAAVVPTDMGWSDVGSWDALWEITGKDASGNSIQGDVFATYAQKAGLSR